MKRLRAGVPVLLLLVLTGFGECNGGGGGPTPPGGGGSGDTFSVSENGAPSIVHTEAPLAGAPRAFDPYIDTYFQSAGAEGPGWVIVLERAYAAGVPAERVALQLGNVAVGSYGTGNGSLSASYQSPTRTLRSQRGVLTPGTVTISRADRRLVGHYEIALCTEAEIAAASCASPVRFAGDFDISRRFLGEDSSPDASLPDLVLHFDSVVRNGATDAVDVAYHIENHGPGAVVAGTYDIYFGLAEDEGNDCEASSDQFFEDNVVGLTALGPSESSPSYAESLPTTILKGWICAVVVYRGQDEIETENNEGWTTFGRFAPAFTIAIDRVRHGAGVMVVDYVLTNATDSTIDYPDRQSGITLQVFVNPASPVGPTSEATYGESFRVILPPRGSYAGRLEFFLGSRGGTSGTVQLRVVDDDDEYWLSEPAEWTGSWTGAFADVGRRDAPTNLGTLPVATFGSIKAESAYQVSVAPGEPVRIRLAGMNDPFGIQNWVPRLDVFQDAGFGTLITTCNRGAPDGLPEAECLVNVPQGVGTLYLLFRLNGASSAVPEQGSSFFFEVKTGDGADLRVEITDVDSEERGGYPILAVEYRVSNTGNQLAYADAVPVSFFLGNDLTAPLPTVRDTPDGIGTALAVVPAGIFLPNTSIAGIQRFDLVALDETWGYVRAVVNGAVVRTDVCPQCTASQVPEASLDNNVSAPAYWTGSERDLVAQLLDTVVQTTPEGREIIVWHVRMRLTGEALERPLEVRFRSLGVSGTGRQVLVSLPFAPGAALRQDRPHDFWVSAWLVNHPTSGTAVIVVDPNARIAQTEAGIANDYLEVPWSLPAP